MDEERFLPSMGTFHPCDVVNRDGIPVNPLLDPNPSNPTGVCPDMSQGEATGQCSRRIRDKQQHLTMNK